jgi:L-asparaginase II
VEESVHLGSIAVADASGRLVAFAGDPSRVAFIRSSAKPLQAAVSLGRIGEEERIGDREVAVMASSHTGEGVHVEAVRGILGATGLGEEALRCPPALPAHPEEIREVPGPAPVFHNCSGKHAGMLLACVRSGEDTRTYLQEDHPLQRAVLEAITAACGGPPEATGVDGCGLPVHAYPLQALATLFARFGDPRRALGSDLGDRAGRVADSMRGEPYLASGRGRIDGAVMKAAPGLLVKNGAEGLACAMLPAGLGLALKIDDGATRGRDAALIRALGLLGALNPDAPPLEPFVRPPVLGGGRPVGEVTAGFDLETG